jgi:antitoxin HicB
VIARQLDALMEYQGLTKSETRGAQLDRLLDPENESVTLGRLTRAAQAVGRQLRMELKPRFRAAPPQTPGELRVR